MSISKETKEPKQEQKSELERMSYAEKSRLFEENKLEILVETKNKGLTTEIINLDVGGILENTPVIGSGERRGDITDWGVYQNGREITDAFEFYTLLNKMKTPTSQEINRQSNEYHQQNNKFINSNNSFVRFIADKNPKFCVDFNKYIKKEKGLLGEILYNDSYKDKYEHDNYSCTRLYIFRLENSKKAINEYNAELRKRLKFESSDLRSKLGLE